MTPDISDAITQAAQQAGIDPAFALAVADRESKGDPTAQASKSMFGLFQMSAPLRQQYGIGNSTDPATQAAGWSRFMNDTRGQLATQLGRDPTNQELYLAHYFGEGRAVQMIGGGIAPNTDVRDVFTPQEIAANPEIGHATNTGALMGSITGDITNRMASYGQNADGSPNFAQFGQPEGGLKSTSQPITGQPIDFSAFGAAPAQVLSMYNDVPQGTGQPVTTQAENAPVPAQATENPSPSAGEQAPSPEPMYGMSGPELQAIQSNPGYRAQMSARMRGGGSPGTEIDVSQIGTKAPNNLSNNAVIGVQSNLQNPGLGLS